MDFVDLDRVLDEFEEEEKQALTISPGRELKPSGYIEFLEQHQEKDWEQINSSGPYSSIGGYTLERKAQKSPISVSYDEPYGNSSSKLNSISDNASDHTSFSSLERSPDSSKLPYQSQIVTSLTRVSSNGEHIGTVYTSLNGHDRKGIANRSERKGTIACQAMEVQTDALSPASEEELMSSPFPKTDIIVDGHGDTSVPHSESLADTGDHNHSPIYASVDHETMLSSNDHGVPALQEFVSESHSTIPNLATADKNDYSSLASNGSSVAEHTIRELSNNIVGFGNSSADDLNEDEVNMYLEEFEGVDEGSDLSSVSLSASGVLTDFQRPANGSNFIADMTAGAQHSMERSLADELLEAQPGIVSEQSLAKKFCPDRSSEHRQGQNPDLVADLALNTQDSSGSCNFSQQNQQIPNCEEFASRNSTQSSVIRDKVDIKNSVQHENQGKFLKESNSCDRNTVFNTVMDGNMEIESLLDDKNKQQSLYICNHISSEILQGKFQIESILDEAISQQQECVKHDLNQKDITVLQSAIVNQPQISANSSNSCDKDAVHEPKEQVMNSLSPTLSSSQHREPGSPMLGVGARPKDPSAIKKNRPNSLMGLSKVNLDFPAVAKDHSPSNFSDPPMQTYQSPESYKTVQPVSEVYQLEDEAKQRMNPDVNHSTEGEQQGVPVIHDFTRPNLPDNTTQQPVDQLESSPPESLEVGNQAGGAKMKRPTSLDLPHRPGFDVCTPEEERDHPVVEEITDQSSVSSNGIHPEHEEEAGAVGQTQNLTQMYSPDYSELEQSGLGYEAPVWIPDADAPVCMMCQAKFTMWKRRHHCRACGKVLCSACCSQKAYLPFLDNKEARVCIECHMLLAQELRVGPGVNSPNPNNPTEYCSKVPPSQQASGNANPPVVMVPTGVLKTSGSQKRPGEPKQVIFSDGIRPGGDLTELDGPDQTRRRRSARAGRRSNQQAAQQPKSEPKTKEDSIMRSPCLVPETGLPPLYILSGDSGVIETDEVLNQIDYTSDYKSEDGPLISYAVNKNLSVGVKIINMDCCVNRWCWCFVTRGMNTAGQAELVVLLELTAEEASKDGGLLPPTDIFLHFQAVYTDALKGSFVCDMGHTIFNQTFLSSRDLGGFLYIQPTFQCVNRLPLPECPYLFGILLQKWEVPWAKVFPIRLLLRLGAEFRYYPCPLVSVANRKPVFLEIGHTIINLLADFRNYQYMLTQIKGVSIHMENKKTVISFPRNRYNDVMKVVRNSNEHVMALGSSFSSEADSHLVCIQSEDGNYQTQAINIQNKPRLVTGASFVVFNGALKASTGLRAKSSIVEDGLMIQILPETLAGLKQALVDMAGFSIQCGPADTEVPEESVEIKWVDNDKSFNLGGKSYLDDTSLEGVECISVKCPVDTLGTGEASEGLAIRWTRVYFLQHDESGTSQFDPLDLSRLTEDVAQATCLALARHLGQLKQEGQVRLGLRVNLTQDAIGYEMGSKGKPLSPAMVTDLDTFLVPIVHQASEEGIVMELVFNIVD